MATMKWGEHEIRGSDKCLSALVPKDLALLIFTIVKSHFLHDSASRFISWRRMRAKKCFIKRIIIDKWILHARTPSVVGAERRIELKRKSYAVINKEKSGNNGRTPSLWLIHIHPATTATAAALHFITRTAIIAPRAHTTWSSNHKYYGFQIQTCSGNEEVNNARRLRSRRPAIPNVQTLYFSSKIRFFDYFTVDRRLCADFIVSPL